MNTIVLLIKDICQTAINKTNIYIYDPIDLLEWLSSVLESGRYDFGSHRS